MSNYSIVGSEFCCTNHPSPEVWKPIPGYEGLYEVSNRGRIKSIAGFKRYAGKQRRIKIRIVRGCRSVCLVDKNGRKKEVLIHLLVLLAFVGPKPKDKQECRHFPDKNPSHNCVENLQWGTYQEQWEDKVVHGTDNTGHRYGEDHPSSTMTEAIVRKARELWVPAKRGKIKWGKYTVAWLSREFKVSKDALWGALLRKTWKHVK